MNISILTPGRVTGAGVLVALAAFAWLTPLIGDADPARQNLSATLALPSLSDPLGADHLGRSVMARLAAAVRLSLGLAFLSVATAAIPGVVLGVLAGWRGGLVDRALSFVADCVLAMPGLLLVLLIAGIAPGAFWPLYVGVALVLWVEYFRVVRASVRTLVLSPQIEASRLLGFGPVYLFRRHIWPEISPMVLTLASFGAASAVLALAALGFTSVGVRPPTAELGLMMTEYLPYYEEAPWIILPPIACTFLVVVSLQLLAGSRRS
jgi:peptide/nickel transport system permease protein